MDPQTPGQQSSQQPSYAPPAPAPVMASSAGAGQTDMVKRFIAYFIDAVILGILANLPIPVIGLVGAIAATAGWLMRDTLLEHRSPGKKIMGLQAVGESGDAVTLNQSVIRNLPFALFGVAAVLGHLTIIGALLSLPIVGVACVAAIVEGIMVATGKPRFGDQFAKTHVISQGQAVVAL
jgi:uncharacterized RDD family membrane protein YckC